MKKKTTPKSTAKTATTTLPYKNPALPVEERVADLMARMTIEEKIGQMNQHPIFWDLHDSVKNKCLGSILCGVDDDIAEYMREAVEETRLGIPLLVGIDAIHGHSMEYGATMFPTQLALSCSWDEELATKVASACAAEMNGTGCAWTFSPVFCMARDLRWGRVDETFGEDPLLIAKMGAAMVRGYQGDDMSDPHKVAACAKHFCGYGETMGGREAGESEYSRRKLEDLFLPPFKAAADAGVATFMTAYQSIDGTPCTLSHYLLTEVLRDRWQSDAMVVTDWANIARLNYNQHVRKDAASGTADAIKAGNDMSMTVEDFYESALAAVKRGDLSEDTINAAVKRILTLKFKLGLFENPRYPDPKIRATTVGKSHALALEAARRSAVLLKNDHTLPLRMDVIRKIAVIGPNADDDLEQLGDWSLGAGQNQGMMQRNPRACTKTILDGIVEEFGKDAQISFARGAGITEPHPERIARAVRLAEESDVVVLVLSDNLRCAGEGRSVATLELQGDQLALVDALHATGTPIVGVFMASKPLVLTKVAPKLDALLCVFNPGMEGGKAVAEIIRGKVNPTGRLSVSFPVHAGQQPCSYNQVPGAHHSDYPDLRGYGFYGLYPFGYGLSYTTVKYFQPKLAKSVLKLSEKVKLSIAVRNGGEVDTTETVQVYFRDLVGSVTTPEKRLCAFKRVPLKSGETKILDFTLSASAFALTNANCESVTEPGEFELMVGPNSRDLQKVKFEFTA